LWAIWGNIFPNNSGHPGLKKTPPQVLFPLFAQLDLPAEEEAAAVVVAANAVETKKDQSLW
jgi:hypothetical protein